MKICTSDEVFPLKIGTVIRVDGDVRYLAGDGLVGVEGWLGICHSGNCRGERFCWGFLPCGGGGGCWVGCSGNQTG